MNKPIRVFLWMVLWVFLFVFFVYETFPYSMLSSRVSSVIEQSLGGKYELRVGELYPSFFTAMVIKDASLASREDDARLPVVKLTKAKARVGLFSLLFGRPSVSFYLDAKKSSIDGSIMLSDTDYQLSVDLDPFDLSDWEYLRSKLGLKMASDIQGTIELSGKRDQLATTNGKVDLELNKIEILPSSIALGAGGSFDLANAIRLAKGSKSRLVMNIEKGAARIEKLVFADGDLNVDASGQVYLATRFESFRLNIQGSFTPSKNFEEAVPILFLVQKYRKEDGSYPFSVSGRITCPQVKVGDFILPTGCQS